MDKRGSNPKSLANLRRGGPGRRKVEGDIRALAMQHGPEAIARLVEWMRSDDARASVTASQVLMDRGYGRAPQSIDLTSGGKALLPPIIEVRAK